MNPSGERHGADGENREGEDPVEAELDQAAKGILRSSGVASRTLDGEGQLSEARPRAQPAQIPLPFGSATDLPNHPRRHEGEIPRVEGQRGSGHPSQEPVVGPVAESQPQGLLPALPAGIDHVVSFPIGLKETGDLFGRILEISVQQHHDLARGVIQRRGQRTLVPEVPRERNRDDPRILPCRCLHHLPGAVGASVVDQHQLVGTSRQGVQDPEDAPDQLGERLLLVEEGGGHRDPWVASHGRALPLKYTIFHNAIPMSPRS